MVKNRNTYQKELIEKEISKFKTFFTSDDLHNKLKDKKIGIATIYRNLKEFRKNNQIYSYSCGGKKIYTTKEKTHCHFICEKCSKVNHFNIENIDFLENKISGKMSSIQLEVKGICDECKKITS